MSLRKRGSLWWMDIVGPDGRRIRRSTGTEHKALAQEYHDRLKTQLWEQARLGVEPEVKLAAKPRHTWQEAAVRWLKEASHKATIEMDKAHLRWLDPHLREKFLDEINRDLVDQIQAKRVGEGVSNATVNRTLETLRAILRRAVEDWEWLDRAPKVRMLKEPKRRVRYLTREEAQRLLSALPSHLVDMAAFTLETGLRRANVTCLQWTQIDLEHRRAWIHPDQAKARKAIAVPLNPAAVAIITKRIRKHPTHVFSFKGKPITQVSTKAWYQALKQAEISDFRWHDLRHTWASWHAQQGPPMSVLQELGGWESEEMVRRYAHFSPEHLSPYADRLRGVGSVNENADGTNVAQR